MKAAARGVVSVDFTKNTINDICLHDPSTHANGPLSGNNVIQFPVVGFNARINVFTGAATSSGVYSPVIQESADGTTWNTLYTFPTQAASLKQTVVVRITKPYLQVNGNVGGTSSTIKCTTTMFY